MKKPHHRIRRTDYRKIIAFHRFDLGIREDEFWGLTPADSAALIERWKFAHRIVNHNTALICATLANVHRDPKSTQAYKPADFMNPFFQAKEQISPDWGAKFCSWADSRIRRQEGGAA